jgi:ABC-2 type transport system ATP-binding protein
VFVSSHLLAEIEAICDHLVMIQSGAIAFQGSMGEMLSAQRSELLAIPEHSADLAALVAVCVEAGHPAHVDGDAVRVPGAGDWAAELNRLAMAKGITLRGLQTPRPSLEEAFFALTDQSGQDGAEGDAGSNDSQTAGLSESRGD